MKKIIITAAAVLIAAGCVVALWMSMRPTVTFLVNGKEADLHCSIDVEYENGMRMDLAQDLYDTLYGIQTGTVADDMGWTVPVE